MHRRQQPLSTHGGARNGRARDPCACGRFKVKDRPLCGRCAEAQRHEIIRNQSDPEYDQRPRCVMMVYACGYWWRV